MSTARATGGTGTRGALTSRGTTTIRSTAHSDPPVAMTAISQGAVVPVERTEAAIPPVATGYQANWLTSPASVIAP